MGSLDYSTSVFSSIKAIPYDEAYPVIAALAADSTLTKVDFAVYKDDNRLPWTLSSVEEIRNSSSRECYASTDHGVPHVCRQLLGSPMITPICRKMDSPLS